MAIDKLISFIDEIIDKPGMYQVNNIEDLHLVLLGYLQGLDDDDSTSFLSGFRMFVNEEFKTNFDYDWSRLIRFHSGGDKGSIDLFRVLFSRYMSTYNKK